MAKIDEYKAAKSKAERFRAFLKSAREGSCDKFGAVVKLTDTYKGYYGNSSCSAWDADIVKAVEAEVSASFKELIERATVNAERAAEAARRAAADEAREVLAEVNPEVTGAEPQRVALAR